MCFRFKYRSFFINLLKIRLVPWMSSVYCVTNASLSVSFDFCFLVKANFASSLEVHWYQAWRSSSLEHPATSIYIDIYYSCHNNSILEKQMGVQLRLCSTNALGTNF